MTTTRREFMRQVGVTLAGLLLSGCDLETRLAGDDKRWRALRACWLALRDTRLQSSGDTTFSNDLRRRHADALKTLVASQELQADVADEIDLAFGEALNHVVRKMATCYAPLRPGAANPYPPREELITQAAALAEMAGRSHIDPATVTRAREALARDMAWLAQFQAGQAPGELSSIEATPAQIEAARILVELLLETK